MTCTKNIGDGLNKALQDLEHDNRSLDGVLQHIDFNRKIGQSTMSDKKLRELIVHFNKVPLHQRNFEFPDLLGAAYEYLIRDFADSAGKKGGEFYTPRAVVRLMVRIADPHQGMNVYDPCVGSGGMLILSKEHIEEQGGDSRDLSLAGQERDGGVWAIAKMNMLLHGIPDADLRNTNDGTLEDPAHIDGGELRRFDRVITNPPFSLNYAKDGIPFPERFPYGWTSEKKKADLMFVQHMLAVTRPGGLVTTVMPHGVLFRGSEEGRIRTGFLDDDVVEAVIGLGPQLFYNTGIVACVLVLRSKGSKPSERRNKVLFINADREYREGRAQNYLEPEHIEKIINAYQAFTDVDGFARVVTRQELRDNDDNLNIRRYVDTSPLPEPQDVRAHLHGGVPVREVDAKRELFTNHGLNTAHLLTSRDSDYLDFADTITNKRQLKSLIETDGGTAAAETEIRDAIGEWWNAQQSQVDKLPTAHDLVGLRKHLLHSFSSALRPFGLLDRFEIAGIIASWWYNDQPDLKGLSTLGYSGLVASWVATVIDALGDEKAKTNALDHKVAVALLPDYLEKLAALEAQAAEVDATIKAAEEIDEEDVGDTETELSQADLKKLKTTRTAHRKQLKTERAAFANKLDAAQEVLDDAAARSLVLALWRADLQALANQRISRRRRVIIKAFETWWDKYKVTLPTIEAERDDAAATFASYLKELSYE